MQQVTYPYEILIRLSQSGVVGAQYQTITDIIDDDGVTILASKMGAVGPLAVGAQSGTPLASIMGEAAAVALLENEQLKGQNLQLQSLVESLMRQIDEMSVS